MKFASNIDLQNNQLQNGVVHPLSSAPSSPSNGQVYYNTSDFGLWYRRNGAWQNLQDALTLAGNAESLYARLASPTFTGTPAAPTAGAGTNTTQIATTAYVIAEILARLASNDAMLYKGVIDASSNPNYPAADAGHTYRISVTGKIGGASGPNVEVGDMIICTTDASASGNHATVGANWDIIQVNIDGAVTLDGSQTLTNKTLTTPTIGDFTNANHNHQNAAGGGTLAESALATTDVTTNNATTAKHGFLKKLSNIATEYMDGTGNWSVPAGGSAPLRFSQDIGDGSTVNIVVTHSLGTRDLTCSVRRATTPWDVIQVDVEMTSTTTATLRFAVAPTSNEFRVTFIG